MRRSIDFCAPVLLFACGSSSSGPDAAPETLIDAATVEDAAATLDASTADANCAIGEATSAATADNPALFGNPIAFADGADLEAGTYEVTYVDGCMKYAGNQDWTVNAYEQGGCCHWWITAGEPSVDVAMAPGNIGYSTGTGAHLNFADCVAASHALESVTFAHSGGPIGVRLQDSNFPDNVPGEGNQNPRWELSRVDCDQ